MNDTLTKQLGKISEKRSKRKKVIVLLLILSLIVAITVAWQLHLTGKSLAGEAFCGIDEHVHTSECYEKILICTQEENEAHTHSDDCYETKLICTKEEHIHTAECYSNETADVETPEDWKKTFSNVELTDSWQQDIISIAKTQIGYKESTDNFVVDDGLNRKGYTRYGEWFGNKYGDWSAMFVSFCVHYAGIPEDAFPYSQSASALEGQLKEYEAFEAGGGYSPKLGDIIFFDSEGKGQPDSVGIVSEIDSVNKTISVIAGDVNDAVAETAYDIADASIFGYGSISAAKNLYQNQVSSYASDYYPEVTKVRPMMQKIVTSGNNLIDVVNGEYEQTYIDKDSHFRATTDENNNPLIEVQITDAYENFECKRVFLHRHSVQDLSPDSDVRNPGITCGCTDTVEITDIRHEKTEDGVDVVIVTFPQSLVNGADDWSLVPYYDVTGYSNVRYPTTFFDYDYSGGANGGNGINNTANFDNPNSTMRLGIGLKDYYHTGGHDQMGNHPWIANFPILDNNNNNLGLNLDANANNGQNPPQTSGYPIIKGLIQGLVGSGYSDIQWATGLDQPGLFTADPKVGKTVYSDYDLDFYNIGNTYVLNGAFNNTTQKMATADYGGAPVYHQGNTGAPLKGGNFWPIDDQGALNQHFNHMYDQNISKFTHNWYFGMRYDISFSLSEDYVGDLYFTFTGDDDLWVFMDGELILDMGGMHSAYPSRYWYEVNPGNRDFETLVDWENKVDLWKYIQEGDTSEHIITVLYMERGGYDSNCYMEFKLPNVKAVSRIIKPNAEIDITKTDENGRALAGAEFTLYYDKDKKKPAPYYTNSNLTQIVNDGKMRTDSNGRVHAYGLSDGEYYLYETRPPNGYEALDDVVLSFTVVDGVIKDYNAPLPNVTATFAGVQIGLGVKNEKAGEAEIDVKVIKKWDDDYSHSGDAVSVTLYCNGEPMAGSNFTVELSEANNWSHIWSGLKKSDAATGQLFKYTVVENVPDNYKAEYSAQWVHGVNAWVKANSIEAGKEYILTNGNDYAMYTNTSVATVFSGNVYPANNTSGNFPVRINGDILTADSIPDNILWTAQANGNYFNFLNKWSNSTAGVTPKYLRIETSTFKTANAGFKSNFFYQNGVLKGYNGSDTAGTQYRIRFENGKFGSGTSATGNNIVPFVLSATPDTYEITVTNVPNYGYELPATGGRGTYIFTFAGLLLMAIPVLYGLNLRRKHERRTKN